MKNIFYIILFLSFLFGRVLAMDFAKYNPLDIFLKGYLKELDADDLDLYKSMYNLDNYIKGIRLKSEREEADIKIFLRKKTNWSKEDKAKESELIMKIFDFKNKQYDISNRVYLGYNIFHKNNTYFRMDFIARSQDVEKIMKLVEKVITDFAILEKRKPSDIIKAVDIAEVINLQHKYEAKNIDKYKHYKSILGNSTKYNLCVKSRKNNLVFISFATVSGESSKQKSIPKCSFGDYMGK